MLVFLVIGMIVVGCIVAAVTLTSRLRRLSSKSCVRLIRDMRYVDLTAVSVVAGNQESLQSEIASSTDLLVQFLGGTDGLQRMDENASALANVSRYLTMMNPDTGELAGVIRQDAAAVKRLTQALRWRNELNMLGFAVSPSKVRRLSSCYARMSRNSLTLCSNLVNEVLPLIQEVTNVQTRMMRVSVPAATADLEAAQSSC